MGLESHKMLDPKYVSVQNEEIINENIRFGLREL